MLYFFLGSLAFIFSALITPLVRGLANWLKILDHPVLERKIHSRPVALLGGLSVFGGFLAALLCYLAICRPDFNIVPLKFFLAIIFGLLILAVGGFLDDKYNLQPKLLWLFPALASLIVVYSGIGVGITQLSNPFGQPISIAYSFFNISLSAILAWLWILGMIFTTKLLDGLDGLCSGVGLIGSLTIFAVSLTPKVNQPITASLAIILAGSLLSFLIYNFHPASIFLGESGSTIIGFLLGVLSIILGAKIATALLVMGIPILDVAWSITRRIFYRQSPFRADRAHLHYRLLDIGLNQKQAVFVLWAISAIFGFTAVFLQSMGKLIALFILFLVMITLAISVVLIYKRQHPHIKKG